MTIRCEGRKGVPSEVAHHSDAGLLVGTFLLGSGPRTWLPAAFFLLIWLILCWALRGRKRHQEETLQRRKNCVELRAKELKITRNSLGETDEVLVVGVHVGQLDVYQQQHLNLRRLKGGGSQHWMLLIGFLYSISST